MLNILSLKNLKINWNSYGSNKVCLKCINRAKKIINIFENKKIFIKFNPKNFKDQIIIFDKNENIVFEKTEPLLSISSISEAIQKISG